MEGAIEEFKIYTEPYIEISSNETLKIDHTFRVVKLCEEIAISLGLNDEDIYIAKMCGLLHDIGRFEQWKRYQTFSDINSYDHGDLGVEILIEGNFIRKFIYENKYDNIILNSVRFHNKHSVPDELSEREKLFINITRDADKIDILYLNTIGHITIDIDDSSFSDIVFDSLMNKKSINRSIMKTKVDRLSVTLGFIFDINFKKSIEILKDSNYINKEIEIYENKTNNKKLKTQLNEIKKFINKYIEEKLN